MKKEMKEKLAAAAKLYVRDVFEAYEEFYDADQLSDPDVYENWFDQEGCEDGVLENMDEKDVEEYCDKYLWTGSGVIYDLLDHYAKIEAKKYESAEV